MQNKRIYLFTKYATELIMMFFFVILVIPGFKTQGHYLRQLFITALFTAFTVVLADRVHIKPVVFAHGLAAMSGFWVAAAIYNQIASHIAGVKTHLWWHPIFDYDKPAVLATVFAVVLMFFMCKLFFRWEYKLFVEYYREFNKFATITFVIFMAIIWIYGFVICRIGTYEEHYVNLVPFKELKAAILNENSDYDFSIFLGNIGIFIPFGVYLTVALKGKMKILLIITPIIVSSLIELSQYFIGNGETDIDDVILNCAGFYLGVVLKFVLDKIIQKRTKGAIKSFFIF